MKALRNPNAGANGVPNDGFVAYIGDDITQALQVMSDGQPVNLTGATEIEIDIANDPSQASAFLQSKLSSGGGIVVTTAATGSINLVISAANSAGLLAQENQECDCTVTDASAKKTTYRLVFGMTIKAKNK